LGDVQHRKKKVHIAQSQVGDMVDSKVVACDGHGKVTFTYRKWLSSRQQRYFIKVMASASALSNRSEKVKKKNRKEPTGTLGIKKEVEE
jgi:hypothetical protein